MHLAEPAFREFTIPRLARVEVDTRTPSSPVVTIWLDDEYTGELRDYQEGPDRYVRCTHVSALDNHRLAAFIEVAKQWDWNHDGEYDADDVVAAIEEALWQTVEEPDRFTRMRGGWFVSLVMAMMPPQPERHIVYGCGDIRRKIHWYDYPWAAVVLVLFVVAFKAQVAVASWLSLSPLTALMIGGERYLHIPDYITLGAVIGLWIGTSRRKSRKAAGVSASMHTIGWLNKAALAEEQGFREGSENWTLWQRTRSCLAFGAIHMVNMIYPFATILPLALCGAGLMAYYNYMLRRTQFRRSAVLAAAVKHRLYNKVVLIVVALQLATASGLNIAEWVGIAGVVIGACVFDSRRLNKRQYLLGYHRASATMVGSSK